MNKERVLRGPAGSQLHCARKNRDRTICGMKIEGWAIVVFYDVPALKTRSLEEGRKWLESVRDLRRSMGVTCGRCLK